VRGVMDFAVWALVAVCAGTAIAVWAKVLGFGGNPDSGEPWLEIAAVLATVGAGGFLVLQSPHE